MDRLQIFFSRKVPCTSLYRQLKYLPPYQFIDRRPKLQDLDVIYEERYYLAIHRDKVRLIKIRIYSKAWFSYGADLPGTTLRHMWTFYRRNMICPRHWSPACRRSWDEFNFAGKSVVNASDKLYVGDKCSHMPQRCPRPCRRLFPR